MPTHGSTIYYAYFNVKDAQHNKEGKKTDLSKCMLGALPLWQQIEDLRSTHKW